MMISDEHGFVFVHIYKTGGSSLTRLVSGLVEPAYRDEAPRTDGDGWQETWHFAGGQHWKMTDLREVPGWRERDLSGHLLITFVRDPYSWLLSIWNNFYQDDSNESAAAFGKLFPDRSFDGFCRFVDACAGGLNPGVWGASTQSSFIRDDGVSDYFIGRFERFEQDLRELGTRLGASVETVPHEVRDEGRDRKHPLEHYSEESIEIVNRVFREDFERFSYRRVSPGDRPPAVPRRNDAA